ncbi:hypothetical protein [Burkholderia cenocepacia]|uniref:hypothetical protein n=1 Tax=Burkholderia cenocepacia TaxID=95486 RepID=UPI000487684A|nr:hypothetical protein [Burkholderia cenocepacia]
MKITDDMLTEWFPADVKPIRDGVYQTTKFNDGGFTFYARWADGEWKFDSHRPDFAAGETLCSPFQNRRWRGLKEKHHG